MQVAVQRTLVSDPILLRHQKELEKKQRQRKTTQDDNISSSTNDQAKVKSNSDLMEPAYATGAHSKEGDMAIRRARELTAMALSQL